MRHLLFSVIFALVPVAAAAQSPTPACSATPAPPPPELNGWSARVPLVAAKAPAGLGKAAFTPGAAVDVGLTPTPTVKYLTPPEKVGGRASHGGLLKLTVAREGTYRVALGGPAWIDVLRAGRAVASTAHRHGPSCTGIRKMVDFPLAAGSYVVQLAGSATATIPAMVARLP